MRWTLLLRLGHRIFHRFNRFNIERFFDIIFSQVLHFILQVCWLNLHTASRMWIFLLLAFCEEKIEIKFSNFLSSNTSDNKRNDIHIQSSWREHTHNYAHNDCEDSFCCHQFFDMNKKIRTLRLLESYTQSIRSNEDVVFDLQHLDLTELKCRYCIYCRTVKFDCIGWHKLTTNLFGRTLSILMWFNE